MVSENTAGSDQTKCTFSFLSISNKLVYNG